MKKARLAGVTVFGSIIVFSSLMHMHKLAGDREWYLETYAYMPEWLAWTRYSFSWFQRILGISAGIGILLYKDVFRKLAIIIGVFTICTVYWKHPYEGFKRHTQYLDQVFPEMTEIATFSSITGYAVLGHIMLDVIFQGWLIYYLTRPKVKSYFK